MKHTIVKTASNLLLAGLVGVTTLAVAQTAQPLTITLKASQIVNQDGKETLKPVQRGRSGDLIQYQATYRNNLQKPMTDVAINLPVPANMVYTGTASPAPTLASLDGKKFEAIPLKRQVNGKWVEVPVSEYRAVRWVVKNLPAQKQATVTMNAKVK